MNKSSFKNLVSPATRLRLKLLFSLALFVGLFIFAKAHLTERWQVVIHANRLYIAIAVAIFVGSVLINAHRWRLLTIAVGFDNPFYKLLQYYYVGLFFNLFLPSTVGGDFSRCYYLSKGTGKYLSAFYSVIADRAFGIAVLFFMATLGILYSPRGINLPWQLKCPVFAGTFVIFIIIPLAPFISKIILGESNWLTRQFCQSAASIYWKNKNLMLVSLSWSVLLQFIMVGIHIVLGMALGLYIIPLWYYFVFYPLVAVLGFITPSFNGIGIREWAYTYFLVIGGADKAHALTYAIMWLGLTTLLSLFGGLVYIAGHFRVPRQDLSPVQQPLSD